MEVSKNWNDAIENAVKFIGESAQAYKMMHLLSAKRYSMLYNFIMYVTLFLSPIISAISTIESVINPVSAPMNITIAILSGIAAIFTAILKFGNFHEKSESHKMVTGKYTSLETNVRMQLKLYRDDRIPSSEYYDWLSNSFNDLFHGAPFIDNSIYNKYYKLSIKKGLVFPNRYDNFITVEKGFSEKMLFDIENKEEIQIISEDSPKNTYNKTEIEIQVESSDDSPKIEKNTQSSEDRSYGTCKPKTDMESPRTTAYNVLPRRRNLQTPISEFNRYCDQQMNYELRRFMNL
jgi:hypothetical protein